MVARYVADAGVTARRSHYELAFESYLDHRGTPYVGVEDVRHFTKEYTGTKAFDYIVYPAGCKACLVDVKGRKSTIRAAGSDCRQRNWVTRDDVTGLLTWQEVFGPDFVATFVFAYWLANWQPPLAAGPEAVTPSCFSFAGRRYSFWVVSVADYSKQKKRLSTRWDTVSVPSEGFRRISRPLETSWPAAPC